MEGVQVGGYRVLRQIGEGGMGAVWLAEHAMLGRRAAIKILHSSYSTRQDIVTRFFNEARAATAISDPGIIQIFDFGFHTDGSAYIVMELLDGEPLDRRLERRGAFSIEDALRICRQVASAVGAAHARNIIHRDLKPENIFIVRDAEVPGGERAKVLDFGIAKLAGDLGAQQKTNTAAIIGTPFYMSPEQCRGAGHVDQRSDVYSLGCVLFSLVTGHAPFIAEGTGELIVMHMTAPPPRPSMRSPGVPSEIDELILRCLAKHPEERFASGTELAAAIDALLSRLPTWQAASSSRNVVPHRWSDTTLGSSAAAVVSLPPVPARHGKLYVGLAALLAAGSVAIAVRTSQRATNTPETAAQPVSSPSLAPEAAKPPPRLSSPQSPSPLTEAPRPVQAKTDIRALLATFSTWAAAHAGAPCPTVADLAGRSDPWGHSYQLTCTDQPADQIVGVVSMGPDGIRGTDDDLTSWTLGRDVTELVRGKRWAAAPAANKPAPPGSPPPPPAMARKPVPDKPVLNKPAPKKPTPPSTPPPSTPPPSTPPPTTPPPAKATGIVDLDGDGIPDAR
ncbi:MAG TPA: protein kinase [Kofleriaceae bacterium]|nr:protein kinase [Kofleriaceae bacterium]